MGEYTVSEVAGEDSEKYILPDDQTVEIKAGETTTVKMHNKLVPEVPLFRRPAITRGCLPSLALLQAWQFCPAALCFSCAIQVKSANLLISR